MNEKALHETVRCIIKVAAKNKLCAFEMLNNLCLSVQVVIQMIAIRYNDNPKDIAQMFSDAVKNGIKAPDDELKKKLEEYVRELLPF